MIVHVDHVIELLNRLLETDPDAISELVNHRVTCNEAMAAHPTVQCGKRINNYTVGLIGILNGCFGVNEKGWGPITIEVNTRGHVLRFVRTPP